MLKRLLGKSPGSAPIKELTSGRAPQGRIDLDRLKLLLEFFPIGKKLRYSPEFKLEIVFDTLIVAYCVNGNFIYSGEAVERDSDGYPMTFRTGENEERIPVSRLTLFQLLVPDTSNFEMKLDYHRRALLGRGRQFSKGNCISLISNAGVKGVSTVDTEVVKQIVLPDGPYAHTSMILLTPGLDTLAVTDQRKRPRAKICVPVMVSLLETKLFRTCTIVDISEGSVRIRVGEDDTAIPMMRRGDQVILEFDLGEAERHYSVKGAVIRRSSETCVIELEGQFRDGKLCSFSPLELLELKAGLLNYG